MEAVNRGVGVREQCSLRVHHAEVGMDTHFLHPRIEHPQKKVQDALRAELTLRAALQIVEDALVIVRVLHGARR